MAMQKSLLFLCRLILLNMFNGHINSWWTKITVGILLLAFIGLQRFIVAVGNRKN
ncbi:hypothetical protein AGMMS50293_31160 [Spirochaetia bacterium]|nr:hypothetical protein AGMMS50293_31160 [Spirochaetia bacterium]